MSYNFDIQVDRSGEGAIKWETAKRFAGSEADKVIAVSTADMDFQMCSEIVEAIRSKAFDRVYGYTCATDEYYQAVISWMQRRHNWLIQRDWIAPVPGIVPSLYYCAYAFTEPGDGVIIQPPVYYPFFEFVEKTGRSLITNPLVKNGSSYEMDFDDLEKKASLPNAKMLVLCSPHNPVGRVWSKDELQRLASICVKNGLIVIADEIHFDIVFPPNRHYAYGNLDPELTKNCIICTSPSKSFNIAGLQVSNLVIQNPEMKKRYIQAALNCGFYSLNTFAYIGCIAAYEHGEKWFDAMLRYVAENDRFVRNYCSENLSQLSITPLEATYLQWIDFSAIGIDCLEREAIFRKKAKVFFESGHIFGEQGRDFERLNLAYPRTVIKEVLDRICITLKDSEFYSR